MICRDEAIVLKTRDFRETSRIAVFYSKSFGKISGIFKGIRKDPRKFATNLEFLSINEIVFYKKRFSELHLVSQCDLRRDFSFLKSNMAKLSLAGFCAEFIYSIMPQEDAQPQIYELVINFLDSLENSNYPKKLLYNFILKALSFSGFQPHLESCVYCRNKIKNQAFFSSRFGGLLCLNCLNKDKQSESILAGTIATILFFQNNPWPKSQRLDVLPFIEKQLNAIIFSFLHYHLEKKFKSLNLLKELLIS